MHFAHRVTRSSMAITSACNRHRLPGSAASLAGSSFSRLSLLRMSTSATSSIAADASLATNSSQTKSSAPASPSHAAAGSSGGVRSRQFPQVPQATKMIKLVDTPGIGKKAVAARHLLPGEKLCTFSSPIHVLPNMHTVCLSPNVHVVPVDNTEFISHACDNTNVCIKVAPSGKQAAVVVTREIAEGEDLSFNYNTTEWDMSSPFVCACEACRAKPFPTVVRGFKHLSPSERMRIAPETSMFIRSKVAEELAQYRSKFAVDSSVSSAGAAVSQTKQQQQQPKAQ